MADQNVNTQTTTVGTATADAKMPAGEGPRPAPAAPRDGAVRVENNAEQRTRTESRSSDAAANEAHEAELRAHEATAKALDAGKTDEQRAADKAWQDADDARARAAQEDREKSQASDGTPLIHARVVAPNTPDDLPAGHHWAQKFGNDPANPAPANGDHANPEKQTVRLERLSPDHPGGPIVTHVHPDMVGDYLRAGWARAAAWI